VAVRSVASKPSCIAECVAPCVVPLASIITMPSMLPVACPYRCSCCLTGSTGGDNACAASGAAPNPAST
jgi:hypothetical protein